MPEPLHHYTGTVTPNAQILVSRIVTGEVARLWDDAVRTNELDNPLTTDGAGAYSFYAIPSIRIVGITAPGGTGDVVDRVGFDCRRPGVARSGKMVATDCFRR